MFVLSKLLSAVTQPLFWLSLWWLLALVMLPRFRRLASSMLWGGLLVFGLLGFANMSIPQVFVANKEWKILRQVSNLSVYDRWNTHYAVEQLNPLPKEAFKSRNARIFKTLARRAGHPSSTPNTKVVDSYRSPYFFTTTKGSVALF